MPSADQANCQTRNRICQNVRLKERDNTNRALSMCKELGANIAAAGNHPFAEKGAED